MKVTWLYVIDYHVHKNLDIDRFMVIKIISPQLYLYINNTVWAGGEQLMDEGML